ncbi:hypothetical protein D9Q98_006822 [Chlorella vulgaris]|uniref:Uncharacterized protein n=1 Tax=Chlorella vulgaris TaxID=3077 RepID=A0A9D4YUN5_CHLVU|nr:hypothetical protein D9Q98_006822 [Chlorella vulgaris]
MDVPSGWPEGQYVRMVVRLSAFQGRLQALVDHGSLVRDHNEVTTHSLAAIFQHLHLQACLRLAAAASEQRRQQRLFDFSQLPQQEQQSQQWQSQQAYQAYASQSSVYQLPPTQTQLHRQQHPQPSWQAASPLAGACPTTPAQQLQSQDSW